MKLQPLFAVLGVLVGCGDNMHVAPDTPARDDEVPRIHIAAPTRGTFAGDVDHVLVTGTVSDDAIAVTVNNVPAVLGDDGTWAANVAVSPGTNLIAAIAIDEQRHQSSETRAVVVGPMVDLERRITGGIRATLSAQALGVLAAQTASELESGGLMTAAQERNPLVDAGSACSYARASITSLSVGHAVVRLVPTSGGIAVTTELADVSIGMHLQWSDACADGTQETTVSAQHVTIESLATVAIAGHRFDVELAEPTVVTTGIDHQLPEVPAPVVEMLHLDPAVSRILGSSTERLVVAALGRMLARYVETRTTDVGGVPVAIDVAPAQIDFSPDGGTITLDTSLVARGGKGPFVFVPNAAPALDTTNGLSLAIADDSANQLLTSLWSAGAFDQATDLRGSAIGELYDSVQLELAVPPHVDASGAPLELTIGDWIATFKRGPVVAATVAIHGKSALYVVAESGTLRMDASTPAVTVDVLGTRKVTEDQRAAIELYARDRVRSASAAAVAAIPLPSAGDIWLTTPWATPRLGYLHVTGNAPEGSK